MTRPRIVFKSSKSIVGAVLVGLGTFILYANLAGAAHRMSHVLGANGLQALGMVPAFVLAVFVQAYTMNHQRFLEGLLQETLATSWPVLLVICGTWLSEDDGAATLNPRSEK